MNLDVLTAEARSLVEKKEALPQGSIVTRKDGKKYVKTSSGWRRHLSKPYKPAGAASRSAKRGHRTRTLNKHLLKTTGVKIVRGRSKTKPKLVKKANLKSSAY